MDNASPLPPLSILGRLDGSCIDTRRFMSMGQNCRLWMGVRLLCEVDLDAVEEVRGLKRVMGSAKRRFVMGKTRKNCSGTRLRNWLIDFDHPLISTKPFVFHFSERNFRNDPARRELLVLPRMLNCFGKMVCLGLLENAVVIDGYEILNPEACVTLTNCSP